MNSNRNYSLQLIQNKTNRSCCFLSRYVYLLRTQLRDEQSPLYNELSSKEKTIVGDAIEEQIRWIDANPNAKIDEFRKHKKQFEAIVVHIINRLEGQNSNATRSQSSGFYGEL